MLLCWRAVQSYLYKRFGSYKFRRENHNSCINIQIGHPSTQVLNHIEVLEDLYKFRDENIRIYIPLSYGDEEYGIVEKAGYYLR